jgi:hypothetical protein
MRAWRSLAGAIVLLAAARTGWAQTTCPLAELVKVGDCCRVQLQMNLTGELKFTRDGKAVPVKLAASATHEFPERVLAVDSTGLAEKTARFYEKATASISAGAEQSQRGLRKERSLIVVQRGKDETLVYSPAGPLYREELELTSEHFNTLTVTGLLAGKQVAVGDTWKVPNSVAQALCSFEGLTEQDLTCKLEEVKDGVARVSVTGTASGIEVGAMVKLKVDATAKFDVNARRLTSLEWKQQDDRAQGPASPASTVQTTVTLTRTSLSEPPECLGDVALVPVPDKEVPSNLLALEFRDPKGRYELVHNRDWQTVGLTDDHLVLRLMERGDFIAQVTVTPWTAAGKGKHLTPEEFKDAMSRTPGWEPEKELQAAEMPTGGDSRWIYRTSYLGKMDGTPVMQNFYLVAGPEGDQVVLLFTMTPKKGEKLGDRDLTFAASVDFPKK